MRANPGLTAGIPLGFSKAREAPQCAMFGGSLKRGFSGQGVPRRVASIYYPDSGIDDKNWRGILAVGQARARKDARLVPSKYERRRRKRPLPERKTPLTVKKTAKCVVYPAIRVVIPPNCPLSKHRSPNGCAPSADPPLSRGGETMEDGRPGAWCPCCGQHEGSPLKWHRQAEGKSRRRSILRHEMRFGGQGTAPPSVSRCLPAVAAIRVPSRPTRPRAAAVPPPWQTASKPPSQSPATPPPKPRPANPRPTQGNDR